MDKKYQDITIVDKNFKSIKLAIPRMSKLISIFFDDERIRIHYIDNNERCCCDTISYEQLTGGYKIVID